MLPQYRGIEVCKTKKVPCRRRPLAISYWLKANSFFPLRNLLFQRPPSAYAEALAEAQASAKESSFLYGEKKIGIKAFINCK